MTDSRHKIALPDQAVTRIITAEQAAAARERLEKKFAERHVAKANFAAMCARLESEPRSPFGSFTQSFDDIVPEGLVQPPVNDQ